VSERVTRPVCLADYERLAHQRLQPNELAFFAGGAADEITVRWNREAFDGIAFSPRVLRGGSGGHTRLSLFGREYKHPIFVAPMALQKLAHKDGEIATAIAAEAQDAGMVLSAQASIPMEDVYRIGATCRWFQLYIQPKREATIALVRRAEAAGFEVLVVPVDAPVNGARTREHRAGFQLPPEISAVNLQGLPAPETTILSPDGSVVFDHLVALAPTWDDIAWLKGQTRLPIVLKGILASEDAAHAMALGVDGIIVSNHGGRTLDTAPATIEVLPEIAAVTQGRIPILLDGGIRRGTDVLKAIARGASAVLVGRPIIYGLAVDGTLGAAHVLRLLRDELEMAMALTGCRTLADAGPHILRAERRDAGP
jgi:4-hydroxymandelate oxidase